MAKNRYGWQKRAKEMARKEKNEEKMKRRQGKAIKVPAEDLPEAAGDSSLDEAILSE
ncbi:MAG: hypothetical protein M1438_18535 [Deltaproteobacteria bacterium]|nr:hypothetical protein [Deltaproteobacteria bacterium]